MMLHLLDRPVVLLLPWLRLYLALLFTPQLRLDLMESNMGLLRNCVALSLSVSLTSCDLRRILSVIKLKYYSLSYLEVLLLEGTRLGELATLKRLLCHWSWSSCRTGR